MKAKILLLEQQGTKSACVDQARAVLEAVESRFGHELDLEPRTLEEPGTFEACRAADAAVVGSLSTARPQHRALFERLGLFAELSPWRLFPAGSIAREPRLIGGAEVILVTDLRGASPDDPSGPVALVASPSPERARAMEALAALAFRVSSARSGHLLAVEAAAELGGAPSFAAACEKAAAAEAHVQWEKAPLDAAAGRLKEAPQSFDVVLTTHFRGELLEAKAGATGSLSRALLGEGTFGLYHPAPSVARSDPEATMAALGAIHGVAMLLRHSLGLMREATAIEEAVAKTIAHALESGGERRLAHALGPSVVRECMTSMAV